MLKKINFFRDKLFILNSHIKLKKEVGDFLIGTYLSIDKEGFNQYKFGGICTNIVNKNKIQHIKMYQNIMNIDLDTSINTTSPLLFDLRIIRKKKKKKKSLIFLLWFILGFN